MFEARKSLANEYSSPPVGPYYNYKWPKNTPSSPWNHTGPLETLLEAEEKFIKCVLWPKLPKYKLKEQPAPKRIDYSYRFWR